MLPIPEGWIHEYAVFVQFEDVDPYSMVHHPRYLFFCERARVELMGRLGMRAEAARGEGEAGEAVGLVVLDAHLRYRTPARFLDELVVRQGVHRIGSARVDLDYCIQRGDERICEASLQLAFVRAGGRPCRAPATVRAGLARMGSPILGRGSGGPGVSM